MIKLLIFYNNYNSIAIITQLENGFSQSLGLLIPRSQSVSGHVVQAAKIELAERDWENALRGLARKWMKTLNGCRQTVPVNEQVYNRNS